MRYVVVILNIVLFLLFIPLLIEEGFSNDGYILFLSIGILIVPPLSILVIWLYTTDDESLFSLWVQVRKKKLKDQLDK